MNAYEPYSEWDNREWEHELDFSGLALFGAGALLGAGVMYLLDPDRGRRRRAIVRDKITRGSRQVGEFADRRGRDLANRMRGAVEERRAQMRDRGGIDDSTLIERVRAQIGHVISNPSSIDVQAEDGRIILRGPVLRGEIDEIRERLEKTRGVRDYILELNEQDEPGKISGLQGGRSQRREGIA